MRLHYERKRLEDIARREAAGENLWSESFPPEARAKLHRAVAAAFPWDGFIDQAEAWKDLLRFAEGAILASLGWMTLDHRNPEVGVLEYLDSCPHDMMPTVVEALVLAYAEVMSDEAVDKLSRDINEVLAEYRIAFELVNGQMVEFVSQEMHAEVVVPTLRLLAGRPGWKRVEATYQKALREIGQDAGDAITDAGTALQDALSLLGLKGNQLGDQIKDAKNRGLLLPHDERLSQGVEKFLHWAAANRSERGDAHPGGDPTRHDAWLMIHITGALILRLARQGDEASPAAP